MPRMRHPNGAGPYEAADEQVPHMRMGGWLTREEWPDELGEWEPAPEPEDDTDEPGTAGEESTPKRPRARAASSKKEHDA